MESSVQLACTGNSRGTGVNEAVGAMPLTHSLPVRLAQAATCRMKDPGTMVPSGVQDADRQRGPAS